MSWDQRRYEQGYAQAEHWFETGGLPLLRAEHAALEGSRGVDEFEVGVRTLIEHAERLALSD